MFPVQKLRFYLTDTFSNVKNNFATFEIGLSVLKVFQLSNGDFFLVACLQHLQSAKTYNSEVRANYPSGRKEATRIRMVSMVPTSSLYVSFSFY